jgi:hypothetical protein
MAITFKKKIAEFHDVVAVDEAEGLLQWLQTKPSARIDLTACVHLHPANLQVLLAAKPGVVAWPTDESFRSWLEPLWNANSEETRNG